MTVHPPGWPSGYRITVIIRCLNEAAHLPKLLSSLQGQTLQADEVLVVDSGSTDNTIEIARSFGSTIVQIRPEDFSFGRSLNLGARHARGELLILVSAHTYPVADTWLERLVAPFTDPDVALAYGAQQGDARTKFSEQQIFRQWFPPRSTGDQAHPFCNNANAAVRRSIWKTMPYDEDIPGLEDIHWAKRARQRGFKIAYAADAAIVHLHDERYRQIRRRYRREAMGLQAINPGEHMTLRHAAALFARACLADVREAARQGVLSRVLVSILCFRAAQYWGTYRGLNWKAPFTDAVRARLYYPELDHPHAGHEGKDERLPLPTRTYDVR
jgi:glycosyltransferase involved in cell wall biosynthesis